MKIKDNLHSKKLLIQVNYAEGFRNVEQKLLVKITLVTHSLLILNMKLSNVVGMRSARGVQECRTK